MHKEHHSDGHWLPSVTTVLGGGGDPPWLIKWRERVGRRADQKLAAANTIGTAFHTHAESLVWGRNVYGETVTSRQYAMLAQFEKWRIEWGFKPLKTELHVVSREHHYAGTLDAIGTVRGHRAPCLFDWKTSSGIKPENALQLAAYAQAYYEQTGIRIKTGYIVLVHKGRPEHRLIVRKYTLGKRLINKFLKLRREFTGVCPEHGEACMRRAA